MRKDIHMRRHTLSFKNALAGITSALKTQLNLRIHFALAASALALGYYLGITNIEYALIVLTIGMVIVSEMANTALEYLGDAVTREHNEYIKVAKDVAAGSVLITAVLSLAVAAIIFLPKLGAITY